jgi:hypothetical protein
VSPEATGPEQRSAGAWWTTLPGVLTGVAGVLTAFAALLVALNQVGLLGGKPSEERPTIGSDETGRKSPAAPFPPISSSLAASDRNSDTVEVDGVKVTVRGAQRRVEHDAPFLDVQYDVATGQNYVDHDPANFVKLMSGGKAVAPVWTSGAPSRLGPRSQTEFAIKFPDPADLGKKIVLVVGESQRVQLPVQVTE